MRNTKIIVMSLIVALSACGETLKEQLRREIDDHEASAAERYRIAVKRSETYSKALELSSEDLRALGRKQDRFAVIPLVDGCFVSFRVDHVCGIQYGGQWADLIIPVATYGCDTMLSAGLGTSYITNLSSRDHAATLAWLHSPTAQARSKAAEWVHNQLAR